MPLHRSVLSCVLLVLASSDCSASVAPIEVAGGCPNRVAPEPSRHEAGAVEDLIDDFEHEGDSLPHRDERNGMWAIGSDGTADALEASGSNQCAARGQRAGHFAGSGLSGWGANWTALLRSPAGTAAQPFDANYLSKLAPEARETLHGVIASSWVDVDTAMQHLQACEDLDTSKEELEQFGRELAGRVTDTWFGTIVRAARNSGFEAMAAVLRQNDKNFSRMYKGGRTTVTELGTKEMVIEDHGNPLLALQVFRCSYLGYMKGLAGLFTKTAYVKLVPPLQHDRHGIATHFSWV